MAELIVVGFQGKHRAAEVLDQVQRLDATTAIDVKDAVAAYRTDDGKLRLDGNVYMTTKQEVASGTLLGALVGVILAVPVAAMAAVPAAAAALGLGGVTLGATTGAVMAFDDITTWKENFGITDEFVREVGGMIQPGQSAVFVLAHASDPAAIAEQFRGYGGKVLRTTLAPEQSRRLQETLAVQDRPVMR